MNTTTYNDRYFEFLRTLLMRLNNGKDNAVFSPFSLLMLLAIAADATEGKTRDEITQVLCGDMDYEEVKEVLSAIQEQISEDGTLYSANAVIAKEKLRPTIINGYEDNLNRVFGGKLFMVKDLVPAVNSWINEQTNGMIPTVANDSMKDLLFALINAITFDAEWETEYEDKDVVNDDFTNADGTTGRVKMLISYENTYLENKDFEGFAKPYKDTGFSYVGLLPKKKGSISDRAIKALEPTSFRVNPEAVVTVTMPEFSCAFDQDVTNIFQDMGIKTLFTEEADFSPFSTERLKSKMIIHKALIEVNRKGTKAAAVSYMGFDAGAAPDFSIEYKTIQLDRPFIYAIVHNATGLPLFIGTVNHLNFLEEDDAMTKNEMWEVFVNMCEQMHGIDSDGVFEFVQNTPEHSFYKRGRIAYGQRNGKELRKTAEEVADYLKNKRDDL